MLGGFKEEIVVEQVRRGETPTDPRVVRDKLWKGTKPRSRRKARGLALVTPTRNKGDRPRRIPGW